MPLSRDPRLDRRRRVLREGIVNSDEEALAETRPRATRSRRTAQGEIEHDTPTAKRSAGYSQSVRKACQQRLVQFIPVRKLSLCAAVLFSLCLPAVLLATHYGIFVSEWLSWKNHPLAAVLDASHPRSLAAWLSSQLWLLCLAATVLTFQLRKYKLDDYDGEYRLWFWLVLTCLIGSIDSTTRVTELFGAALDRWSQLHVGWSGGAIVQATLAALVGMLGLRLCSELKAVPTSLILWLLGLTCWAGSAALSQSLFRIDISYQLRIWLRASLWLVGLTSIWVAALFYLRSVYMEAQRRFILRSRLLKADSIPLRERIVRAIPHGPFMRPPKLDPNQTDSELDASEYAKVARGSRASGLLGMFRKTTDQGASPTNEKRNDARAQSVGSLTNSTRPQGPLTPTAPAIQIRNKPIETRAAENDKLITADQPRRSWFRRTKQVHAEPRKKLTLRERFSWRRSASAAISSSKQNVTSKPANSPNAQTMSSTQPVKTIDRKAPKDQSKAAAKKRLKLPGLRFPKLRFPKLRFPKLKIPSFRLPPPELGSGIQQKSGASEGLRPANSSSRPLPGTGPSSSGVQPNKSPLGENFARSISRAERKKLRRLGRDEDSDHKAA